MPFEVLIEVSEEPMAVVAVVEEAVGLFALPLYSWSMK